MVLTSELFGSPHLQTNYMFYDGLCAAFGVYLLGNVLPSAFYVAPPGAGHQACIGLGCFGPSQAIGAGLCAVATAAAVVMARRSSQLYRRIGRSLRRRAATARGGAGWDGDAALLIQAGTAGGGAGGRQHGQ